MMRTYEETTERVFERIKEQKKLQNQRKQHILRTTAVVCPVCIVALAGVCIWRMQSASPSVGIELQSSETEKNYGVTAPILMTQETMPVSISQPSQTMQEEMLGAASMETKTVPAQTIPPISDVPTIQITTAPQQKATVIERKQDVCDHLLTLVFQDKMYVEARGIAADTLTPKENLGTIQGMMDLYGGEAQLYSGRAGQGTEISAETAVYSVEEADWLIVLIQPDGTRFPYALCKKTLPDEQEDMQAVLSLEMDDILYVEAYSGILTDRLMPQEKLGTIGELIESGAVKFYTGYGRERTLPDENSEVYTVKDDMYTLLLIQPNGERIAFAQNK